MGCLWLRSQGSPPSPTCTRVGSYLTSAQHPIPADWGHRANIQAWDQEAWSVRKTRWGSRAESCRPCSQGPPTPRRLSRPREARRLGGTGRAGGTTLDRGTRDAWSGKAALAGSGRASERPPPGQMAGVALMGRDRNPTPHRLPRPSSALSPSLQLARSGWVWSPSSPGRRAGSPTRARASSCPQEAQRAGVQLSFPARGSHSKCTSAFPSLA